jgi:hypothetical protein
MDARQAAQTLEVIRTLMERATQYQLLTARAGLIAGTLASIGAMSFGVLDPADPWQFGAVWAVVFGGSLAATVIGTVLRGRAAGEQVWSRQTRAVVGALAPSLFAAIVLTVLFFRWGMHEWLPGVWMLCYGQGALATAAYAPSPVRGLGLAMLFLGPVALAMGPDWGVLLMGLGFGAGHIVLGAALLACERRQSALRLHREVA